MDILDHREDDERRGQCRCPCLCMAMTHRVLGTMYRCSQCVMGNHSASIGGDDSETQRLRQSK